MQRLLTPESCIQSIARCAETIAQRALMCCRQSHELMGDLKHCGFKLGDALLCSA